MVKECFDIKKKNADSAVIVFFFLAGKKMCETEKETKTEHGLKIMAKHLKTQVKK